MGQVIEGVWSGRHGATARTAASSASRPSSATGSPTDGSPGPTGAGGFKAEAGRYHLYVSLACPWAHRTLIMRRLKGLEDAIGVSVVHWHMAEHGWDVRGRPRRHRRPPVRRSTTCTRSTPGPSPTTAGRVDRAGALGPRDARRSSTTNRAEIIRMLNSGVRRRRRARAATTTRSRCARRSTRSTRGLRARQQRRLQGRLRAPPGRLRGGGDRAVRDAGRARRAPGKPALPRRRRASPRPTSACSRRSSASTRSTSATSSATCGAWSTTRTSGRTRASSTSSPGIADTVDFHHIKQHYYGSHATVNPTGIVPLGPLLDWDLPHGRN